MTFLSVYDVDASTLAYSDALAPAPLPLLALHLQDYFMAMGQENSALSPPPYVPMVPLSFGWINKLNYNLPITQMQLLAR